MSSQSTEFAFRLQETYPTFNEESVGFGPHVVQRKHLVDEIIDQANPHRSVHISGCKGAGKTTLLHLVGKVLANRGDTVYLFESATDLNRENVIQWVKGMARTKQEVYLLVDETQSNAGAGLFTLLLKNNSRHKITTIGAGVPEFPTVSGSFKHRITTDRLFLTEPMLSSEGIIDYFARPYIERREEIAKLLEFLRSHVGGHVYPLMSLAELLVPLIGANHASAGEAQAHFESFAFRQQEHFRDLAIRILPDVTVTDIRPLLYKMRDPQTVKDLQKKGFCDVRGKIISPFLFEAFVQAQCGDQSAQETITGNLNAGIEGVRQLLCHALPGLNWDQYAAHGGPIEDALTFELMLGLTVFSRLGTFLFNPKLINAGTAARKPDLYVNSTIDSYVECVLTTGINATEQKKLDEHIARFRPKTDGSPYYNIGSSSFAILNYQKRGNAPLQPHDSAYQGRVFNERVFTFLMASKEVYRGNTRIGP